MIHKPRMICIYGESGDTKTTQAYHLARWLNETYGLKGRMIGSNASDSAPFVDSGMIENGIIDFFDISNRELALADCRRLAKGYWPRRVKIGNEVIEDYLKSDDICLTKPEEWKKVGFYIVEGIQGISNLLLNHIRQQEDSVGFKHSYKYEEDGEIIGGLQEGHYGIVQQELYKQIVQGYGCLPVKYVIFTSLVGKGEDKRKNDTIYGPKAAGQASTFEIPSWFMDTFHLANETILNTDGSVKGIGKVAWFVKHPDKDTGINYLAKFRCMPEIFPKLMERYPGGYVPLGFKKGIDKIYQTNKELIEEFGKMGEKVKENANK